MVHHLVEDGVQDANNEARNDTQNDVHPKIGGRKALQEGAKDEHDHINRHERLKGMKRGASVVARHKHRRVGVNYQ